ncbi:hypothetical protein FRB94_003078 [Tulasnella sp. JGI-2019a]|nr:hypothetical protein FRB94_003078 [Tulasnella sp. JGI-2019a]
MVPSILPVNTRDDIESTPINPSASNPGARSSVGQSPPSHPTGSKTAAHHPLKPTGHSAIPQEAIAHPGTPLTTGVPCEEPSPPETRRPLNVKDAL